MLYTDDSSLSMNSVRYLIEMISRNVFPPIINVWFHISDSVFINVVYSLAWLAIRKCLRDERHIGTDSIKSKEKN